MGPWPIDESFFKPRPRSARRRCFRTSVSPSHHGAKSVLFWVNVLRTRARPPRRSSCWGPRRSGSARPAPSREATGCKWRPSPSARTTAGRSSHTGVASVFPTFSAGRPRCQRAISRDRCALRHLNRAAVRHGEPTRRPSTRHRDRRGSGAGQLLRGARASARNALFWVSMCSETRAPLP